MIKSNRTCLLYALLLCSMSMWGKSKDINLELYEMRIISQNGEDGILQKIFDVIGTTNKYYVEFGAGNGHFCSNTKYLREQFGWTGLLLEGSCQENERINLHKAFITAENICDLFETYDVPEEFDFISIDIDRNDFYVWRALSEKYSPRVVAIEFNSFFNFDQDKVIAYDPYASWTGGEYSGASILALFKLGRTLGYSLVYQESNGANLFFIRDDVLASTGASFLHMNDVSKLYTATPKWLNLSGRGFVSSSDVLR